MGIILNDNLEINAPKPIRTTDRVGADWVYATKNDIPISMRYEFMQTIDDDGKTWRLEGGVADANWTEVVNGNSANTLFDGNRQIKALPTVGQNLGTSTLAEFIEAAFFPFIEAVISLNGGVEYYEINSHITVSFSGVITANDETSFSNANIVGSDDTKNVSFVAQAGNFGAEINDIDADIDFTARVEVGGNGTTAVIVSNTKSIRFIYAAYYGKNSTGAVPTADDIIAGTKVIVLTNSNFTVNPNTDGSEYGWFAVPHAQTGKLYTAWYVTALNNSSIGPDEFIVNAGAIDVNGIAYDIYMYGFASELNANLKLS